MTDKPYKIGMYGGKFLPFNKGHRYCVEFAAKECETVYVILFWGGADEDSIRAEQPEIWLSVEERQKQMMKICEDASAYAKIIPALIDITHLRNPDGSDDWEAETPLVRGLLGNQLDAVYSSEESCGEYFTEAYPETVHRLVDIRRIHYPISSTEIRSMNDEKERLKWMI